MKAQGEGEGDMQFLFKHTSVLLNFAAAFSRVRWVGGGLVSGSQERLQHTRDPNSSLQ